MSKQQSKPSIVINWKATAVGVGFGLLLVLILFRKLYCFYTFQYPSASVITIVFGFASGILGNLLQSMEMKSLKPLAHLLMGLMITLAILMLVTPFLTELNKNFCVKDFQTLVSLIEEEGEAVVAKDMNTIRSIYDPSAVVSKADTAEVWQAYVFYSQKFASEEHCEVNHLDYLVQEFSTNQVRLTTGSRGTFGRNGQGCISAYANPSGSDEWTFQKIHGEWKIVYFEFNKGPTLP